MRDLAVLFLHLLATVARLAGPGGTRSAVAESVLVKHQLLILSRFRKRSPSLRPAANVVASLCAVFICPGRFIRSAVVFKTSTLLRLHRTLIQRKVGRLFSLCVANFERLRKVVIRHAHGPQQAQFSASPTSQGWIRVVF